MLEIGTPGFAAAEIGSDSYCYIFLHSLELHDVIPLEVSRLVYILTIPYQLFYSSFQMRLSLACLFYMRVVILEMYC